MTDAQATRLSIVARKMMLTASQAVALPSVISKAASGQGMSEDALIDACMNNAGVCQYLASVCRTVTA